MFRSTSMSDIYVNSSVNFKPSLINSAFVGE
jgi:hypothetical protein